MGWIKAVIICTALISTNCIHGQDVITEDFFPFGTEVGDAELPPNDDSGSAPIVLATPFRFFNSSYSNLFVNTNGLLSFNGVVSQYTPQPFPIASRPVIAAFWADVDIRTAGHVYYREVADDAAILARMSDAVRSVYSARGLYYFQATWGFIATYSAVPAFPTNSQAINNFQIVLVTDGTHSFTIYNYGLLQWSVASSQGGIDAQVGFDAGDGVNFFAVPTSRTPQIININMESNIGRPGRWMFQIDSIEIDDPSGCEVEGPCQAHETLVDTDCVVVAPALSECPELVGPVIVDFNRNQYVYFYCQWTQTLNETDEFEIHWMFNNERDLNVPSVVIRGEENGEEKNISAALHEKYLSGHMGEWVSCEVISRFQGSADESVPVKSQAYWLGIKATDYEVVVRETDEDSTDIHLISTVPISCQANLFPGGADCYQRFAITSSSDLLVFQPGRPGETGDRGDNEYNCHYYLYAEDWDSANGQVYAQDLPLQIRTIRTAYNEPDYIDNIHVVPDLPTNVMFDEFGEQYESMWTGYTPEPILVYRVSGDLTSATCTASGDPRMSTFDNTYYSIYPAGQFVMTRSSTWRKFEVQIRTYTCAQALSCTCGVVVREGNETLSLDMCDDLGAPHRIVRFASGSSYMTRGQISVDGSGRRYTITMESGAFVNVNTYYWGMNVIVHVLGQDYDRVTGLCGTYNQNTQDEFLMSDGTMDTSGDHSAFIRSWTIPLGESYFERNPDLVIPPTSPVLSFCSCADNPEEIIPCGNIVDAYSFSYLTNTDAFIQPSLVNENSRRKRQTDGNGDSNYEIDDSYFPHNFTIVEGDNSAPDASWPTPSGIRPEQAQTRCREAITRGSCDADGVSLAVSKCFTDIQETDSFDWIMDKLEEVQFECVNNAIESVRVSATGMENQGDAIREMIEQTMVERLVEVRENQCPNNCFDQGDCVQSRCVCYEGFTGLDCSLDNSTTPEFLGLPSGPVCDVYLRQCQMIRVTTNNVFDSLNLMCRLVYNNIVENVRAHIQSIDEVLCILPDQYETMRIEASTVIDYSISITRDGTNYGTSGDLRVYNSACMICETTGNCDIKNDTCSIDGQCYMDGETNEFNQCEICDTPLQNSTWSFNYEIEECLNAAYPIHTFSAMLSTAMLFLFTLWQHI